MKADVPNYTFAGDELSSPIVIYDLEKKSEYDFSIPHRHNYNEIFFFVRGEGKHMIDFESHEIEDNSIHIVSLNKIHKVHRGKESFGKVVLFDNNFLKKYNTEIDLFFLIDCEKVNLNKKLFDELFEYLNKIKTELKVANNINYKIISVFLHLILLKLRQYILDESSEEFKLSKNELYKNFYNLLEDNFTCERQTKFYEEKLNLESAALNYELKQITGKTASRLIKDRLLLESKRLLLHEAMTISEIAFNLSFSDVSHFSKFFKKETNVNPSDFRLELKKYKRN